MQAGGRLLFIITAPVTLCGAFHVDWKISPFKNCQWNNELHIHSKDTNAVVKPHVMSHDIESHVNKGCVTLKA